MKTLISLVPLLGLSFQAYAQGVQLPARFGYAAKFVCGVSTTQTTSPPKEPAVKRGNYATIVNMHNPWGRDVVIQKRVAIAAPEKYPNTALVRPTKRFDDKLPPDYAMSVDCTEIVNLLTLNGTPPATPFVEGFLLIDASFPAALSNDSAADINVVAVTTAAAPNLTAAGAVGDTGIASHEVTPVQGKRLPAGTWPQ